MIKPQKAKHVGENVQLHLFYFSKYGCNYK